MGELDGLECIGNSVGCFEFFEEDGGFVAYSYDVKKDFKRFK
jgi:hypothetical protein